MSQGYKAIRANEEHVGISLSSYKAIKANGGGHRDRSLKATRLSRLLERYVDIGFSRLSRLQEGDAEIRF